MTKHWTPEELSQVVNTYHQIELAAEAAAFEYCCSQGYRIKSIKILDITYDPKLKEGYIDFVRFSRPNVRFGDPRWLEAAHTIEETTHTMPIDVLFKKKGK